MGHLAKTVGGHSSVVTRVCVCAWTLLSLSQLSTAGVNLAREAQCSHNTTSKLSCLLSRICPLAHRPTQKTRHKDERSPKHFRPFLAHRASFSLGLQGADCPPCSNHPPHQLLMVCELHPCWNSHHAGTRLFRLPPRGKCLQKATAVLQLHSLMISMKHEWVQSPHYILC